MSSDHHNGSNDPQEQEVTSANGKQNKQAAQGPNECYYLDNTMIPEPNSGPAYSPEEAFYYYNKNLNNTTGQNQPTQPRVPLGENGSKACHQLSSTNLMAPSDYEHIYRNTQGRNSRRAMGTPNAGNIELADFVVKFVVDFISRQDPKYFR